MGFVERGVEMIFLFLFLFLFFAEREGKGRLGICRSSERICVRVVIWEVFLVGKKGMGIEHELK